MRPIFSRVLAWAGGVAVIPIALALGATSASAGTVLITFDDDPLGLIEGNYFHSGNLTQIHFVDGATQDADGEVGDMRIIPSPNGTNALAVYFSSDDGGLEILLDLPAESISMDFPFFASYSEDDVAELTAFLGTDEVGNASAALMEGGIVFDAALFNRVELEFVVPGGTVEVVDNVSVSVALIPEPQAAIVFSVGALLVGAACRRR